MSRSAASELVFTVCICVPNGFLDLKELKAFLFTTHVFAGDLLQLPC